MTALEQLLEASRVPCNKAVKEWQGQGKKVVGFFCAYIPEEMLSAADILPYRVRPIGCAETTSADVYLSRYNCTFARSCLEFALNGTFGFLDGIVSMNSCDHIRRLYDVWKAKKPYPYMHFLSVPHKIGSEAAKWYQGELTRFKESIEGAFGTSITDGKLKEAIDINNTSRSLLLKLYELRKVEHPPITGTEAQQIVMASTAMPKEKFNQLLAQALGEIEQRPGITNHRARLMVSGSLYDDPEFTQIIEEAGGLVVTDTLCFGSRYFFNPVETNSDLLYSLAQSYLERPSCARMAEANTDRAEFMKNMIEAFHVQGVIYQRMQYCDLWGGEMLYLRKFLKELDIPVLPLAREYWLSGVGGLKTRIEAFLETIGG